MVKESNKILVSDKLYNLIRKTYDESQKCHFYYTEEADEPFCDLYDKVEEVSDSQINKQYINIRKLENDLDIDCGIEKVLLAAKNGFYIKKKDGIKKIDHWDFIVDFGNQCLTILHKLMYDAGYGQYDEVEDPIYELDDYVHFYKYGDIWALTEDELK